LESSSDLDFDTRTAIPFLNNDTGFPAPVAFFDDDPFIPVTTANGCVRLPHAVLVA
jgi:hypothetical protein